MDEEDFEKVEKEDISSEEAHSATPADESSHALTHKKKAGSLDLADDFICSVCLLVAVQPTTLVCGHTSCRICLARWYFTSKKKECPLCRQPYQGHPKINAHIRNMIAKVCPKELNEREEELSQDIEDMRTLKKYDLEVSKESNPERNNGSAFCLGVVLAFSVVVIAYLAWYWQSSETNLLVMKPVQLWKPNDVAAWLEDLRWASVYVNRSVESNIDGNMLLAMDEGSVRQLLNISDPVHQRAFLYAVDMLKELKVKVPSTLWEYKALYPGRCLFLVHGLKEFPRATILYMWLYFYEDMFLPFVKAATESAHETVNVSSPVTLADRIGPSQWAYFLFSAAVLPQWLVIVLAYHLFFYHFFTSLFIIIMAILIQILEILDIVSVLRNNILEDRNIFHVLKNYGRQMIHAFLFMVAWPIIPRFVCDVVFYAALFIRPFYTFNTVCRKLRQHINLQ